MIQQKLLGPGPGTLLTALKAPAGSGVSVSTVAGEAQAWYRAHAALRGLDDSGHHAEAVQSALAGDSATRFALLAAALSKGITVARLSSRHKPAVARRRSPGWPRA